MWLNYTHSLRHIRLIYTCCYIPSPTRLSTAPDFAVPSTITMATVQINEINDVITWQPPAEPNGVILHYNIRISRNGTGFVREVTRVTETRYDFSTLGLSAGTYGVQVCLLYVR